MEKEKNQNGEKLALLICGDESEKELKDIARAVEENDKEALSIYGLRKGIHDTCERIKKERKESFLGFVPQRLEVRGRPELINFPLSVLFASLKQDETGKKTTKAIALYEPALYTLKDNGKEQSMVYVNKFGKCYLEIFYNKVRGDYLGKKYVNDKLVLESTGADWNGFFQHFTTLGLSDGEACLFE